MAVFTGGMFLGMVLTAVVKIPAAKRHFWFLVCGVVSMACLTVFPFEGRFPLAVALLGVAGFANAVFNVFIDSVIQLAVPQSMRGKVFSFIGMITQGLTPVAFALAGMLAEFLPLAPLMSACFASTILLGAPMFFLASFRRFINFDPQKDTIEGVS
jgi:MFS transporter, DHA3 family, macrolide efflux protein